MTTTGVNISFWIGQDVVVPFQITDTDITGWALEATFRRRGMAAAELTKSTADGITITDGDALGGGLGEIAIADTNTDALPEGAYLWSLWRTDAGFEEPLIVGVLSLLDSSRS